MIHRSVIDSIGIFDPRYQVCEDYELWIRLTDKFEVGWIPEPLTRKHAGHADQLSKAIPVMDRFRLHALLHSWLGLPHRRQEIRSVIASKAKILAAGAEKRDQPHALYQRCYDFGAAADSGSATDPSEAKRLLRAMEVSMNDRNWHCAGAWRSSDCGP